MIKKIATYITSDRWRHGSEKKAKAHVRMVFRGMVIRLCLETGLNPKEADKVFGALDKEAEALYRLLSDLFEEVEEG